MLRHPSAAPKYPRASNITRCNLIASTWFKGRKVPDSLSKPTTRRHRQPHSFRCKTRRPANLSLSRSTRASTAYNYQPRSRCLPSQPHRQTWRREFPFPVCALRSPPLAACTVKIEDTHTNQNCVTRFGSAFRSFWHTMTSYDRRMLIDFRPSKLHSNNVNRFILRLSLPHRTTRSTRTKPTCPSHICRYHRIRISR